MQRGDERGMPRPYAPRLLRLGRPLQKARVPRPGAPRGASSICVVIIVVLSHRPVTSLRVIPTTERRAPHRLAIIDVEDMTTEEEAKPFIFRLLYHFRVKSRFHVAIPAFVSKLSRFQAYILSRHCEVANIWGG